MLKNKRILLVLIFTLVLFLVPSICNASDTFTTEDGIVATKLVQSTNGDIEIKFSDIELSLEGSYTWAIGRSSLVDEIEYSANLGDFSETNKTALISLTTSQKELWTILRKTNTVYIFIKDEKANQYIVNALKIDLTLPLLKAFKVTKSRK